MLEEILNKNGSIIITSKTKLEPKDIINNILDNSRVLNHPFIVLEETTEEEFDKQEIENFGNIGEKWKYFYKVSTD